MFIRKFSALKRTNKNYKIIFQINQKNFIYVKNKSWKRANNFHRIHNKNKNRFLSRNGTQRIYYQNLKDLHFIEGWVV